MLDMMAGATIFSWGAKSASNWVSTGSQVTGQPVWYPVGNNRYLALLKRLPVLENIETSYNR
jgi:hypothetical protein